MTTVILAVVVLGVLGLAFGAVLGVASKVFAVEVDQRESAIKEILPGANCGGCGYPGCGGYAAAVAKGEAAPNCCAAGGAAVAAQIAEIMGMKVEATQRQVAYVRCTGGGKAHLKYDYVGLDDCLAAARLPAGGPLDCQFGCLGMGSCVKACPFDAIHLVDGVAQVDEEACKGCKACVATCPRSIITMVPYGQQVKVPCSSKSKGADTRKACDNGCIGCRLCEKNCPADAIHVVDNVAVIDYSKCTACGTCVTKCPRKLITGKDLAPAESAG